MFGGSNLPEKLKLRLRENTVGELTIRLLKRNFTDEPENPYLDRIIASGKKAYFVVCPHNVLVLGLKERLSGLCAVPTHLLVLYFLGKCMKDEDTVPETAFELPTYEDSDDDVFQPRIYMEVLYDPEDPDAPETSTQRDRRLAREKAEQEAIEQELKAEEERKKEKERLAEAARVAALEEKIRKKEEHALFDLEGELTKINCGIHYEAMKAAGLQDEGAFASMDEDTLAGEGLWIPRLARIRILSLRDAFHRKQEMIYQQKHGSHYGEVEEFGRDRVDASGKHFKTKKELEDYWKKQQAEEEARLKRLRDGIQPKPHAKALQEKINKIRVDEARDEDGMLIKDAYRMIYEPAKFCCKTHQIESTKNRTNYLEVRQRGHMAEFEVSIDHADVYRNGYLSREILQLLARIQCDKLLRAPTHRVVPEHETITIARINPDGPSDRSPEASPVRPRIKRTEVQEAERRAQREEKWKKSKDDAYATIDKILNKCLLSARAQDVMVNWSGPKEIFANVGSIPTERYDVHKFTLLMNDLFRKIDHERYLEETQW